MMKKMVVALREVIMEKMAVIMQKRMMIFHLAICAESKSRKGAKISREWRRLRKIA